MYNFVSASKVLLNGIELPQHQVAFKHTPRGRPYMELTLQDMQLEITVTLLNTENNERVEVTGVLTTPILTGTIANGKNTLLVDSDYVEVTDEWLMLNEPQKILALKQSESGVKEQTQNAQISYERLLNCLRRLRQN